jgi:hypothetical protein
MEQLYSPHTPEQWADETCEVINNIAKWTLTPKQQEAVKRPMRGWVIDIREDETNAVIARIRELAEKGSVTSEQIIAMLQQWLPKRPG